MAPSTQTASSFFSTFAAYNDLPVSMEAFVALSPLFGYKLVDRSHIRQRQDVTLMRDMEYWRPPEKLIAPIEDKFYFGSVDWMVSQNASGLLAFTPVEVNGSLVAGVLDLPIQRFEAVVQSFSDSLEKSPVPPPYVFLLGYLDEKNTNIHERIAVAEGIKAFHPEKLFRFVSSVDVATPGFVFEEQAIYFVVGPILHLLESLCIRDKQLHLHNLPVGIISYDLSVDRILKKLPDFAHCQQNTLVINRIHTLTNSKANTYRQFTKTIFPAMQPHYPLRAFDAWQASDQNTLETQCIELLERFQKPLVIKPNSGAIGTGVHFLHPDMDRATLVKRIQESVSEVSDRYQDTTEIFPYTISDFIDTTLAQFPSLGLLNRKFEIRIFVVQEKNGLRALPSEVKLATQEYNAAEFSRASIQTNTRRFAQKTDKPIRKAFEAFIQPLNNRETLQGLQLSPPKIQQLCEMSTVIIDHLCAAYAE